MPFEWNARLITPRDQRKRKDASPRRGPTTPRRPGIASRLARASDGAQIADAVRRFRHHTYELPGRLPESIEEHVQLADAISRGDAVEAERIATEHIRNLAQLRLKMLMERYWRPARLRPPRGAGDR